MIQSGVILGIAIGLVFFFAIAGISLGVCVAVMLLKKWRIY